MDIHFVEECLMLTECRHCKKVIEIHRYASHLISECENRNQVETCEMCSTVVDVDGLNEHECRNERPEKGERCPLCLDRIIVVSSQKAEQY